MKHVFIQTGLFFLVICILVPEAKAIDPSLTILDPSTVGATTMGVGDISGDGTTLVGYVSSGGSPEAYRWTTSEGMVRLGLGTGGRYSGGGAVSYDGSIVVGRASTPANGEAFSWTAAGGIQMLGDLPGGFADSSAGGISNDGSVIVGRGEPSSSDGGNAVRWTTSGGMVDMGDVPDPAHSNTYSEARVISADGTVIAGYTEPSPNGAGESWRWTAEGGMVLLGFIPTAISTANEPLGISADGSTVVGWGHTGEDRVGYRWTEGTGMQALGDLSGGQFWSKAYDVSGDGSVAVGQSATDGLIGLSAFIWDETHGMRNLQDVLSINYGLDFGTFILTEATAISDNGTVLAGIGRYESQHTGPNIAWIAIIPEPATLGLLAIGGVAVIRRKRAGFR